jgi:hypothetical protein
LRERGGGGVAQIAVFTRNGVVAVVAGSCFTFENVIKNKNTILFFPVLVIIYTHKKWGVVC